MKILLTNFRLAERTGSECVILDVARGLHERGHEVAVYTPELGPLGTTLRDQLCIPVVTRPEEAPWVPEVIHGQHLIPTALALLAFPETPALYYAHGSGPLEERPPLHPRVRRWLAPSTRFQSWFAREYGIPEDRFLFAPNFVDTARFRPAPAGARANAKRALLYHTNLRRGAELEMLRQACGLTGFEFDAVGYAFGGGTDSPETLLPQYDVVFTSGRSALEALACGCTVLIVGEGRISEPLTPETFATALESNLASISVHAAMDTDTVASSLRTIEPADRAALAGRVHSDHSLTSALDQLEACYRAVQSEGIPAPDEQADQKLLHQALSTAAAVLAANRQETARLRQGWEETKRKREAAVAELAVVKAALADRGRPDKKRPGWFQKLWRKRIRS